MNCKMKHTIYPWLMLGLGVAAALLRRGLLLAADGRGLVPSGHPVYPVLLGLTLLAAFLAWLPARGKGNLAYNGGKAAAPGQLCFALGIALTVLSPTASSYLTLLWKVLGLCAGASLLAAALGLWMGKRNGFLSYGPSCLFLILHMILRYRPWSGNPQWIEYLFELLGVVCLLLFAYQRAAATLGEGNRRILLLSGLLGIYCCVAAVPGGYGPILSLGGGLWLLFECICLLKNGGRKTAEGEDGTV